MSTACGEANKEVRASLQWQNFVIPVLVVMGIAAAVTAVRYYLRDLTEIALLEKAEADRRLKPPRTEQPKFEGGLQGIIEYVRAKYEDRKQQIQDKVNEVKTSILSEIRRRLKLKALRKTTNAKVLFGIEVEPSSRRFPIKPGKFKIFIGFFQIFGNFQNAFVINWSPDVQGIMNFASQFNLVRNETIDITHIDPCVCRIWWQLLALIVSLQKISTLTLRTLLIYNE